MTYKTIRPLILVILDGWGIAPNSKGNAISHAKTPHMTKFKNSYPYAELRASGEAVGLPKEEDGNSEVGHLNIGAGRIVYQDLPRINMAIADGQFLQNPVLIHAIKHAKARKSVVHLMGLIGQGTVHSSLEHVYALLWLAKVHGMRPERVAIHIFTDGRDGPPTGGLGIVATIEKKIAEIGVGTIATVCGRYYAMDRDHHWMRTEKAYRLLTKGEGHQALTPYQAVEHAYQKGLTDEFIEPTVIVDSQKDPRAIVSAHDSVISFNYRGDRARQLAQAFVVDDFKTLKTRKFVETEYHDTVTGARVEVKTFARGAKIADLYFVTMSEYERGLSVSGIAFPPEDVKMPIARVLAEHGMRQLHVAETEKYPHVTYFFNGGREEAFRGEERMMFPSPPVSTYDKKPQMSTEQIVAYIIKSLNQRKYDFIVVNFACPDMVGHTGIFNAGVAAVEAADAAVGEVAQETLAHNGVCVITADHGNVEEMISLKTGDVDTKHSTSPVPFIVVGNPFLGRRHLPNGILADVAPTILAILDLPKATDMTGRNLLASP